MKKTLSVFLLLAIISLYKSFAASDASAALITITNKGEVVWEVLGDSTSLDIPKPPQISIKSIAENTPSNNSQIALDNTNGKITLNGMDVTGTKTDLVEVVARGDANNLKISQSNGQFTIEENGITANTSFPININPVKNELTVRTPSGDRLISILPYEAAISLVRGKFIDKVKDNKINLNENGNGQLEYLISGTKSINLFNVAEINADVTGSVSASNGEVIKIDEPQWLKLFGFLFS